MDCSTSGSLIDNPLSHRIDTNSCPLSWWYCLTISAYAAYFFCLQSFPVLGSFPMSQLFASGGQSPGASASASVLPMNIQGWFPLGLTALISWGIRDSQESSPASQFKSTILQHSAFFIVQLSHQYMTTENIIPLTVWTFVSKGASLLFNKLSRFAITLLSRSKHLLISWMQSSSVVILDPKKRKSVTVSTFSPAICHEVMGPNAMILVFWILSFKPTFSVYFTLIKRLFGSSSLSAIRVVCHLHV